MNTWKPVTLTNQPEPTDAIPFVMSKNDRDSVALARLDILAMQREQGRFTPGLVAKAVSPDELTPAERMAFGLEG
jgi:hypothetical protein